jgi:glycosyltransferase involved in cell wall biosynthesis
MPRITVTVITKNEADALADALTSVSWADEIIVIDAESTDDTVNIARRFTDRVYVRAWSGYVDQKNHAASVASHDWIFSLDADERVTPILAEEIRALMSKGEPSDAGFRMPRVSFYLDKWIRTTDMYPDYQLRLYDRRRAKWHGLLVHESVRADGHVGYLKSELQHHPYKNLSEHLIRMDRYTTLAARQMRLQGKRATAVQLLFHPKLAFLRNYILKGGFRDGVAGLVISLVNSYYVFLKFAKLWELQRRPQSDMPASPPHD